MPTRAWTREELVSTLALYYQTEFGKMHSRNPTVVAHAESIGRTPSAVALKLVNFASMDPDLQGRGVAGMSNTSRMDREIWREYHGRWSELADHTPPQHQSNTERTSHATERFGSVKQRRGQSFFRAAVMAAYEHKCCITGVSTPALLRASHIVPWSSDASLRLDPRNGLCLNALHDAAFDRGLITLGEGYELKISGRLKAEVPGGIYLEMFQSREGLPIALPERCKPLSDALSYHRERVFEG